MARTACKHHSVTEEFNRALEAPNPFPWQQRLPLAGPREKGMFMAKPALLGVACCAVFSISQAQAQQAPAPGPSLSAPVLTLGLEAAIGYESSYTQAGGRLSLGARLLFLPRVALYLRLPVDIGRVYFHSGGNDDTTIAVVPSVEAQVPVRPTTALAAFLGGGLWGAMRECIIDCEGPFYGTHPVIRVGLGLRTSVQKGVDLLVDASLDRILGNRALYVVGLQLGLGFHLAE